MPVKIYKLGYNKTIEYMVRNEWDNHEYIDDALERAAVLTALKLTFWRKYPIFGRLNFTRAISGAWFELISLISYERGKFYSDFRERALRKFGREEVFMELDSSEISQREVYQQKS
jgi:hypothetical protein